MKSIPLKWRLAFFVTSGSFLGLFLFLIHISNFFSYLSDKPETCMNCHIMGPEYATWYHSSHREVSNCNDCHVPQDNFFKKWIFKGMDGMRHATIFTLRGEDQAIVIKDAGKWAVQKNCIRCHKNIFKHMEDLEPSLLTENNGKGRVCWDCHRETPHGLVRSLTSAPFARVPTTESMVPAWLSKLLKNEKNN